LGRFLPNALRQGKRLLYAQNLPFKSGFTIFQIERLLLREKQTLDCLESGADGRQKTANFGHSLHAAALF
jgi:hypothetical protein